jgi:hypothetical protein
VNPFSSAPKALAEDSRFSYVALSLLSPLLRSQQEDTHAKARMQDSIFHLRYGSFFWDFHVDLRT